MSEIERIIDELEREYAGDPWHGSPLRSILGGITAARAAARPIGSAHSIWEIVLHMTGWKNEVRNRLGGAAAREPEEGDWPEVRDPSEAHWHQALARLDRAHRDLIGAIRVLPEAKLFEPTNDRRDPETGAGVTHYVLLHGIVQHDVYHSGQVALLRKAVQAG